MAARSSVAAELVLPEVYDPVAFFAFHGRDAARPNGAEWIRGNTLYKGLMLGEQPARVRLTLAGEAARCQLEVDGPKTALTSNLAEALGSRLLGLDPAVERFEQVHARHAQLGPLLSQQAGLHLPGTASAFEALFWAIIGQMVSVAAAVAARRRLIRAVGRCHSSGMACLPGPADLLRLTREDLRQCGLSGMKADCLLLVCEAINRGHLPLSEWQECLDPEEVQTQLRGLRGIGPWTASYTLLRGFGYLDACLEGDVAVRQGLRRLLGQDGAVSQAQARDWLREFSPWRGLVAAHLWAFGVGRPVLPEPQPTRVTDPPAAPA